MTHLCFKRLLRMTGLIFVALCSILVGCTGAGDATPTAPEAATATPMPTATPIPPSQYLLEGDAALLEGDFIRADEAYSQTLQVDPQYALAYSHRAWLYAQQPERWATSLELAQKAVEMEPESSEAWAYLSLVQTANGHYGALPAAAEKAVALDEDSALAQVALARAQLALNAADDAQEAITVALELEPDNVLALMVQAKCYSALGQFDSAMLAAARATSLAPDFLPARLVLADVTMRATEYPEAEAELQRILEQNPEHVPALVSSTLLDMARGDTNAAAITLRKLTEMAPDLPSVLSLRGAFYLKEEAAGVALEAYERLLETDPDFWMARVSRGFAQLAVEDCDEAAETFHELLNLSPKDGQAHLGLALAMECQGETSRAQEGYRQAQALAAHDPITLMGVARHYLAQGDYEKAIENYHAALMQRVDQPDLYFDLGVIHLSSQEYADAERAFKHVLALEPDRLDAWYGLAQTAFQQGDYEKTVETLKEMEVVNKGYLSGDEQALMGMAYCELGKYEQAAQDLQLGLSEGAQDPLSLLYLGRARRELGQPAEAAEAFATYLELNDAQLTETFKAILGVTAYALHEDAYELSEAQGEELTQLVFEEMFKYLGDEVSLKKATIEAIEERRAMHMVVEMDTLSQYDDATLVDLVVGLVTGSAMSVPRVEPRLDGGLWITFQNAAGEEQIEARAPYTTVLDLSEGLGWDSTDTFTQVTIQDLRAMSATLTLAEQIEAIKRDVEKERGLKPKEDVAFEMLTPETWEETLETEYAEDEEALHVMRDAWVLMGLLDPEVDLVRMLIELESTQVAGFYRWEENVLYVIGDGEILDPMEELTFAHEYLHALQDQHYGLEQIEDVGDDDQSMAFRSLAEGEATQFTIKYLQTYLTEFEALAVVNSSSQPQLAGTSTPGILERMQIYPYEIGLDFVEVVAPGGYWPNIEKTYGDPPASTEQILHPEKYKDEERDEPQTVQLLEALSVLTTTWTVLDNEVGGELWTREYLGEYVAPDLAAVAAAGWDGDRYLLLEHPDDGRDILIWQTVWDSTDDAWEFVTAHRLGLTPERGYEEVERQIQPGERNLRWKHDDRSIYLQQRGDTTVLVFASAAQDLDEVLALLETK